VTAQLRADARACHEAALEAVEPAHRVRAHLVRESGGLELRDAGGEVLARHAGSILVVGAGKAALAMGRAAAVAAGVGCIGGGVIVPYGTDETLPHGLAVAYGGHPLPDAAGEHASARLLAAVAGLDVRTLALVVLSGGASAMLVAPAPGLTLADKQTVTARLLAAGADVGALNTVRKHCSRIKGGLLARAAVRAAGLWALVLSDVVGDDPATIASGPTVADPTTFADAAAVLARHLAPDDVPPGIATRLAHGLAGRVPETPKPGDRALARARTLVIGGNRDALAATAAAARARGYLTEQVTDPLTGDAGAAGRRLAAHLARLRRDRAVALVAGGETTVRVVEGRRGGRCQHLALAAAVVLAGAPAVLLAAGTDGIDGSTDAGGACVDGDTVARARARGLDAEAALAATDSHRLLAATGDLLPGGPTGTNVADVVVALRAAC
jgi:glycerate-2-kinase